MQGAIQTLQDLKQAGKIRFLGVSSILPNLIDHIQMDVFDVFRIPYSALQPEHEAAIAEASQAGAGIVIRGGVARGEPGAGQGSADVWKLWERAQLDELLEGMSGHGVHAALHHHQPGRAYHHRGDAQPDAPPGECRGGIARAAAGCHVPRGQARLADARAVLSA